MSDIVLSVEIRVRYISDRVLSVEIKTVISNLTLSRDKIRQDKDRPIKEIRGKDKDNAIPNATQ